MTENTGCFSENKTPKIKLLSPRFIYAKLLFIYALIYTLSFAVGCILSHSLDANDIIGGERQISHYFSADLSKCNNVFDFTDMIFQISDTDISHLIIVFTAGFTLLVGPIIAILLIFRGFSLGFSVSYIAAAIHTNSSAITNSYFAIITFSLISSSIAVVLIHFAVKTVCFSDDFKMLCGRPRLIIKSRALYKQLLRVIIALGAILILNTARCIV